MFSTERIAKPINNFHTRVTAPSLSEGKSKLVPVRLQGKVTAGLQYYVSDTICNPDSVLVYAPEGILDTITTAYTQKINLENISDTTRQRISLAPLRGVKFVPSSVEATFPVDIYTEKTVEVPLHGINFPADKALRAFPSKVQITFQVGLKRFRSIKAGHRAAVGDIRLFKEFRSLSEIHADTAYYIH